MNKEIATVNPVVSGNDVHFEVIVDNNCIRTYKMGEGQLAKHFISGYNAAIRNTK